MRYPTPIRTGRRILEVSKFQKSGINFECFPKSACNKALNCTISTQRKSSGKITPRKCIDDLPDENSDQGLSPVLLENDQLEENSFCEFQPRGLLEKLQEEYKESTERVIMLETRIRKLETLVTKSHKGQSEQSSTKLMRELEEKRVEYKKLIEFNSKLNRQIQILKSNKPQETTLPATINCGMENSKVIRQYKDIIHELENTLKLLQESKEQEARKLKEEITKLKSDVRLIEEENKSLKRTGMASASTMQSYAKNLSSMKSENQQLIKEKCNLNDKMKALEKRNETLRKINLQLGKKHEELQTEIAKGKRRHIDINSVRSVSEIKENMMGRIGHVYDKELKEFHSLREKSRKDLIVAENELKRIEGNNSSQEVIEESIDRLEEEHHREVKKYQVRELKLKEDVSNLTSVINVLKEELILTKNKSANNSHKMCEEQGKFLKDSINESSLSDGTMSLDDKRKESGVDKSELRLKEVPSDLVDKNNDDKELLEENEQLKDEVMNKKNEIEALKALMQRDKSYEEEVNVLRKEKKLLEMNIKRLNDSISEVESILRDTKNDYNKEIDDLKVKYREELVNIKQVFESKLKEADSLHIKRINKEYSNNLMKYKELISSLGESIAKTRSEYMENIDCKDRKIESIKSKVHVLEKSVKKLIKFILNYNKALNEQANKQEEIIKDLEAKLLESKTENDKLKEEQNRVIENTKQIEKQYNESKEEVLHLNKLKDEYNIQILKHKTAIKSIQETNNMLIEDFSSQIHKLERENEALRLQCNNIIEKTKLKEVQDELTTIKYMNTEYTIIIKKLNTDNKTLTKQLVVLEENYNRLLNTSEMEKKKLKGISEELIEKNSELISLLTKAEESIINLNEELTEYKNPKNSLSTELEEQKNKVEETKKQLRNIVKLEETIKELQLKVIKQEEAISKQDKELHEVKKERDDYEKKYNEKIEELGKVRTKVEKLKANFEKYNKKKDEANLNTIHSLTEQLNDLKNVNMNLTREISLLHSQLNKPLQDDKGSSLVKEEKYKQLLKEKDQLLEKEVSKHKDKLMKFKQDYSKVYQDMNTLKKKLVEVREYSKNKGKEIELLKAKLTQYMKRSPSKSTEA